MKKFIDFIVDLLNENIKKNLNPELEPFINLIINGLNSYDSKPLKPKIIANKENNNHSLESIDFGNIHVKKATVKKVVFESNHKLPIVDYREKTACRGPTCSHNIRHLVDVIITAARDLIADNFGNHSNFLSSLISDTIKFLSFTSLDIINAIDNSIISDQLLPVIKNSINYLESNGALSKIVKYVNDNLGQILFTLLGKVEKHGIQLGKCGNLISGIKINQSDNRVLVDNDKPFIVYKGKVEKLFDCKDNYNFNTIHCIYEMNSYKEIYKIINSDFNLPNDIKEILNFNIMNTTNPSNKVLEDYNNYLVNRFVPKRYTIKLKSFDQFINDGWKLPSNIEAWDTLFKYVVPSIFSDSLYTINDNQKTTFYSNYDFIQVNEFSNYVFLKSSDYDEGIISYEENKEI